MGNEIFKIMYKFVQHQKEHKISISDARQFCVITGVNDFLFTKHANRLRYHFDIRLEVLNMRTDFLIIT